MLADFLTVIPQTPSLVLATYRPEYGGALARVRGAQTIALAPLSASETAALVSELIGPDLSVGALGQTIAERAAGNPFFAEEIARVLAERGCWRCRPRVYTSTTEVADITGSLPHCRRPSLRASTGFTRTPNACSTPPR